jgi:hypothetical protein
MKSELETEQILKGRLENLKFGERQLASLTFLPTTIAQQACLDNNIETATPPDHKRLIIPLH